MKKILLSIIFLLSVSVLISQTTENQTQGVILKIKGHTALPYDFDAEKKKTGIDELDIFIATNQVTRINHLYTGKNKPELLFRLEFTSNTDINRIIESIKLLSCIDIAETDFIASIGGTQSVTPNDALFNRQWSLYNDGTFTGSPAVAGADIKMKNAWSVTQGDTNIVVGVIDTGVKHDHPEFTGRIWVNKQEIPNNGIDDDGNGFIDDVRGWNFSTGNNNVMDDNGHGTNVAGIIGANGNNTIGYAGVDWKCKLMPLKVLDWQGNGQNSKIIEGIYYAVDNGANVVNMSLGGTSYSLLYQDAIDYAVNNNVIVVACMMNANDETTYYPAGLEGVIAVGATKANDTRANPYTGSLMSGSCYGEHISVIAPGDYIYGLHYNSNTNYEYYYCGTSQAAPHVAGLASLLLAQNPNRTVEDIRMLIESTAQDGVGLAMEDKPLWDKYYGFGRINAEQALTVVQSNKTLSLSVMGNGAINMPTGSQTLPFGKLINLSAIPQPEYYLQKWVINGIDYTEPPTELIFRMNKNFTIQAVFALRPVKYVTVNGAGLKNGTSWSNAYGNAEFQDGINSSTKGTMFWVAQGTYYPTENLPNLSVNNGKSFIIRDNTVIYGGFLGNETLLSQRDYINNITVFSGDLGVLNVNTDNAYHVVWFDKKNKSSFLDGIIIRNGYALGVINTDDRNGGGVFKGILYNCIIENNNAYDFGAGAYKCELYNCTVRNNGPNGAFLKGGGLYDGIAENCVFENNNAREGGGIYIGTVANSEFIDNVALKEGGALYMGTVTNSNFTNNEAEKGGGMYLGTASHSNFYDNYADYGGGVANTQIFKCNLSSNNAINGGAVYESIVDSCIVELNNAAVNGGASYNSEVTNSEINFNKALRGGGAYLGTISNTTLLNDSARLGGAAFNVVLENCTLKNNKAYEFGGAVNIGTLINCHLENNLCNGNGGGLYEGNALNCTFLNNMSYSQGGAGFNSIFNDCVFTGNRGSWGGAISESEADSCSFTGNVAQFSGGGAYNSIITNSTFVNDTASIGGAARECVLTNCTLTANYASDKSGGLHMGDAINCLFENNSSLSGGAGAASNINAVNSVFNNNSTLGGGGALHSSTANNCNFNSNSAGSGGAMFNCEAVKCTILNNTAINGGGTYYGKYDSCFYSLNIAKTQGQGGGAYNGIISNSTFDGDSAHLGGAAYTAELFNCILINNKAVQNGGAVYACTVKNSLLYNNKAYNNGGAAFSGRLLNSTIVENKTQSSGGGTYNSNLINCIVWGNKKFNGTYDQKWGGADTSTAIQSASAPTGPNNIALSEFNQGSQSGINYPVFLDPANGNFRLQPSSAGFNAGNSTYAQSLFADNNGNIIISSQVDLDGNTRIVGTYIDLGAYETSTSTLTILPSLNGTTSPISGTYNYNNAYTAILNAIPNTGYHFFKWTVNGADSLNPIMNLLMNTDYTIQAFFEVNQYNFTLSKTGNGTINHSLGTTFYDYATVLDLTATPDVNNCFVKWICNGSDSLNTNITITIDTNYQIEAIFSDHAELDLSINGNGSVNHATGITQYSLGSQIELIATPDVHNLFVKWVVNGADSLNPTLNLLMNTYYTVEAIFEPEKHELNLSIYGNGQVNHQSGITMYDYGSAISLTASVNTGYTFEKWIVNGMDSLNPTISFIMDTDYIVEAHFDTLEFSFTLSVSGNGSVNHSLGSTPYNYGSVLQLTATPDVDYHFDKWKVNGVNNFSNPLQITIQDNTTLEAIFLYNTSIDEISNNTISIYPNPVGNNLFINSSESGLKRVEVFNELGQLIYNNLCNNLNFFVINTTEFDAGIYFIRLITSDEVDYYKKFIK